MESPLIILIELITGLISRVSESLSFVFSKFVELLFSLALLTTLGPLGLLISATIVAVVLLFISKFFFGASKTLILLGLGLIVLLVVFTLILSVNPPPAANTTIS